MDKFVLHGVPISCAMEEVALSIQQSYPGTLKLVQTLRWLTTDTKRQASRKDMSTVVLAIGGSTPSNHSAINTCTCATAGAGWTSTVASRKSWHSFLARGENKTAG